MANNTGTFFNINDNDGIPLVGVSTDGKVMINHLYGNCLIGSTSVTGTASQPLQVTGGAYVSGNLGIGTTQPTVKLQVQGDGNFTGVVTAIRFNGQINAGVSTISVNSSSDALRITQTGSGNALVVEDEASPDATHFVIAGNGNVGINTNIPSSEYKLQVHDSFIQVTNSVEGTGISKGLTIGYDSSLNSQIITSFAKPLVLNTSSVGTSLVLQSIATRRVGIGSTTPNNKLDVIGNTYISGNLGIGTTNPTVKLDVIGDVNVLGVVTASSFVGGLAGIASTATTALGFSTTSSINTTGIITATGGFVGSLTGIASTATTALGLSTTASIDTTGIITATGGFVGSLVGIASTATTALGFSTTASINTTGIITASTLNIGTGGTVFTTTSIGNIGIGTTNPTTRISIAGTTGISFADSNIRIGDVSTGSSITSGTNNLFAGNAAAYNNTSGSSNNFIGYQAGYANTNGSNNNFFGSQAGSQISNSFGGGNDNNFFGYQTGYGNRGFNNNFLGRLAGYNSSSGENNNFFGQEAGYVNSGSDNNFLGYRAGYRNSGAQNNNFFGSRTGYENTGGSNNNFFGYQAGQENTSGSNNIFVGQNAGAANTTGSRNIVIGFNQNTPIISGDNQLVIGAGSTAWIHGNSSYNVGFGTTNPTAKIHIGAATTSAAGGAPLKIGAGTTILTTPEVGAIEYDGSYLYQTPNSTSGRAYVPPVYSFRLTANGANIGATIADFFATTSSLSLEASSVYKITCFAYFTKTTAGTATWTHTFSSAPTIFTSSLTYSPVTGIANGTQTNVLSYSGGQSTASMAHAATASLTTGVNHFSRFELIAVTNAATNWRLRLTQSAGTATPLAGSFYTIEKVGPSTGTFVA
jgi:hypothetical protein